MGYTKEIKERTTQIEHLEPKLDLSVFRKRTNAKTPSGLILSRAKECRKRGNLDMALLLQELYKEVFNLEKSERIRINSWRGKGGIKVWATPDKILVEFVGPRDKDEKPNIQRKEYTKQEINQMIVCINKLKDEFDNKIPSRQLGEDYFKGTWDMNVFSKRPNHTKFTHLLNILDYYNIIRYSRAGFTVVLRNVREIQEVLK